MNIVAQYPNLTPLNLNIQIESVQRDSAQREIVPPLSKSDGSSNQYELSNKDKENKNTHSYESDSIDEQDDDLVYDFAKITQKHGKDGSEGNEEAEQGSGNDDTSPQNEKKPNGEYLTNGEQKELDQLKDRDQEVRTHELKHQSVGGQYASAPTYTTQTGPDGKEYAVGGEVQISTSEESTPEKTIAKMQQVRRAALAPAEPSSQDYSVANEAKQKEIAARQELTKQRTENTSEDGEKEKAEPFSSVKGSDQSQNNSNVNKAQKNNSSNSNNNNVQIKHSSDQGSLAATFRNVISSRYNSSWMAHNSSVSAYA